MTTPEKSVEESVKLVIENAATCSQNRSILQGDELADEVLIECLTLNIQSLLQAERQKREEVVEAERERIALIVRSIDFEVRQTDVRVEAATWQSIKNLKETVLQALTQTNNQK